MTKTKGSKAGEVLDVETGAKNIAANLAAENLAAAAETPTEAKKRGRKPSDRMTLAKWAAMLDNGNIDPDKVEVIPPQIVNGVMQYARFAYKTPIVSFGEDGSLSMVRLTTDKRNRPVEEPITSKTPAEVLEWLTAKS